MTRKSRNSLGINAARVARRAVAIGSGAVLLAGCSFGGLNSLNMPGTAGHGKGSFNITVEVPDVATLPQNSPVMVDNVTVGSVSGIEAVQRPDGTFYAAVQLSLDENVKLPANATVRVAQTSLLGSQHIELAPPVGQPPEGELREGIHLPLNQGSRYPTTEEVLSALGVVVNKGNLGALQDITQEVYNAVAGREGQFAGLIPRLAELAASLNRQTEDIIATAEGLNRFAGVLARSRDSLGRALDTLPGALRVLNENRASIIDAFAALQRLGTVASRILSETKDDFAQDIIDAYSVIKPLNDVRADLVTSLDSFATFPFPGKNLKRVARGDYFNIFSVFDLTIRRLGETIFTTSFFDPNMKRLAEVVNPPEFLTGQMANLSGQAADPFKIPPGTASGQEVPPN
ncbi:mammalian cell entry protein [Mycolicibacterium moriokaense]|uniref:Mammalian cell entry protein n=1 Tax=Mycolicibacterium moriokaense TaxID=39691 RepID=A0AAD1M4K5_9MYCO|nr:MCE family protein [Mycolicibacterium moriokaense]MCV7041475.1 MCE family protein [Mycolicibacterium moriokaense]ORB12894.1 mammalian cell entry protein [Mycolicibacterium moriokaense]BBX00332.1 mammalian cell entry protein [Mycolicibacterium moriokaense]